MHHVHLVWEQKHHFVMSEYFEETFPIKRMISFILVRFEFDYYSYTLMCLRECN